MTSLAFRKPMTLVRYGADTGSARPSRTASAGVTVLGATRHRLDDRAQDAGVVTQQERIVYLPPDVAIEPGDELTFDGRTWTVVGIPNAAWSQRTNSAHHLELRVRWAAR